MTESGPDGPSRSAPRGTASGTNFSLFSENAERVELCLFDDDDNETRGRADRAHRVQLARLPAGRRAGPALRLPRPRPLRPGRRPPLQPAQAADRPVREVDRGQGPLEPRQRAPVRARPEAGDDADLELDDEDSAIAIPKCVVIDPRFDWEDDRPPNTPLHETVIYETHVKGFTKRHPGRARGPARHLRRAAPTRRRSSTSSSSASPRSSCCRSTTSPTSPSSPSAG